MFGQSAQQIHQPSLATWPCGYEAKAVPVMLVRQVGDWHTLSGQLNGYGLQSPDHNGRRNLKLCDDLLKELIVGRGGHHTSLLGIQAIFAPEPLRARQRRAREAGADPASPR
ncbi:MAG: hypothetical protein MZV64_50495 [Ignavibacteriales bacterium]|nr:hypothetical protein [Ignavibacteriales bacterium]